MFWTLNTAEMLIIHEEWRHDSRQWFLPTRHWAALLGEARAEGYCGA